ncbi:MAG TPA: O-antigen ligase family protein, partial [Chloroflexota bacterium]
TWVVRERGFLRARSLLGGLGLLGLALAIGALPLEAVAALVGIVVVVPLAFYRPAALLYVLILVIPFSSLAEVEVGDFAISVTEPLVALLLLAWLAKGVTRRAITWRLTALGAVLMVSLGVQGVSALGAIDLLDSAKEILKWVELLVAFSVVAVDVAPEERWRLLAVASVAAAAEATVGVVQFVAGIGPPAFAIGPFMRAHGNFEQPNPFAGYLAMMLPLAVTGALLGARSRWVWWVSLATGPAIALGLLLSLSRGGWLGAAAGVGAVLLVWSQATRRLLVLAVVAGLALVVAAVLGAMPAVVAERMQATVEYFGVFDVRAIEVTPENWAVAERLAHWQAAWSMFLSRPVFGVGVGNYAAAYPDHFILGWDNPLGHAHNFYLNVLAEQGLAGLAVWLILLLVVVRTALANLDRSGMATARRAVNVAVLGQTAAFATHSLFDNLFVHGLGVLIGLLWGMLIVEDRSDG